MKSRIIKPGFFENEILAELPMSHRLTFLGLWLLADRDGKVKDTPKFIKKSILPYDDCDMDLILDDLSTHKFIERYVVDEYKIIQIIKWKLHQRIHPKEAKSVLPSPCNYRELPESSVEFPYTTTSTSTFTSTSTSALVPYGAPYPAYGPEAVGREFEGSTKPEVEEVPHRAETFNDFSICLIGIWKKAKERNSFLPSKTKLSDEDMEKILIWKTTPDYPLLVEKAINWVAQKCGKDGLIDGFKPHLMGIINPDTKLREYASRWDAYLKNLPRVFGPSEGPSPSDALAKMAALRHSNKRVV